MSTKTAEELKAEAEQAVEESKRNKDLAALAKDEAQDNSRTAQNAAETATNAQERAEKAAARSEEVAQQTVETATQEAAYQAKATAENTTLNVLVAEGVIPPKLTGTVQPAGIAERPALQSTAPGPLRAAEEVVVRKKQINADIEREHDIIADIRRRADQEVSAHANRIVALQKEADELPAKVRKLMGEVDERQAEIEKVFGIAAQPAGQQA